MLSAVIVTYIIGYFSDLLAGGEDFLIKQASTTAYTGCDPEKLYRIFRNMTNK